MTAVEDSIARADGAAGLTGWMTCVRDRREHAVSELDFVAGVADGRYTAICGHLVMPRALVSPSGPRCAACVATMGLRVTTEDAWPPRPGRGRDEVWRLAAAPRWVLSWAREALGRNRSE